MGARARDSARESSAAPGTPFRKSKPRKKNKKKTRTNRRRRGRGDGRSVKELLAIMGERAETMRRMQYLGERGERAAPQREMRGGDELDRTETLHHRYVGVGIGNIQRHPPRLDSYPRSGT